VDPVFLNLDEVLAFHEDQIRQHGGSTGIRDRGLLESALAAPAATFGGTFLNGDLFEMAAAYLHGLCSNHPFVDGNKRVAAVTALVFLKVNGVDLPVATKAYEAMVLAVARGELEKSDIAVFLRHKARKPKR
jgi:death-on-curing protein